MSDKPFLLIKGELLQLTDASFGGNGESMWVDHVLCRDGKNRCTLRGETLSGALLATARKLFTDIPKEISHRDLKQPSVWRVFTSHPVSEIENTAVRQNVCIDSETGAAKDGALFDSETLARGTVWPFFLEVDLDRAENPEQVKAVTFHALQEWMNGYCWLGRSVARGTGWFELQNVKIAEVGWNDWPNSELEEISDTLFTHAQSLKTNGLAQPDSSWRRRCYEIRLHVAPESEVYGIDFLAVSGHSGDALLLDVQNDLKGKLLSPQTTLNQQNIYADSVFSYTRIKEGVIEPYIAGSALRGVLRHAAEWWANKQGEKLDSFDHPLNQLFGIIKADKAQAGAMLMRDAHIIPNTTWQAVLLKMHAEDEFAGGVYGSSLFDKLALTQASFRATFVIEAESEAELDKLTAALQPALKLAEQGFLGLGSGAWRGFGHLCWQITEVKA